MYVILSVILEARWARFSKEHPSMEMSMSRAIADSVNQLQGSSPAKELGETITKAVAEYLIFFLLSLVVMH